MADTITFEFLDVGMGDSTLVKIRPDKQAYDTLWLVDFGEKGTQFKEPHKEAMDYLADAIDENSFKTPGQTRPFVDVLILTHPDQDHYNKVATLVQPTKKVKVKRVARYPHFPGKKLNFGAVYYSGTEAEYGTLLSTRLKGLVDDPSFPTPFALDDHSPVASNGSVKEWKLYGKNTRVYLLSANYPVVATPLTAKGKKVPLLTNAKSVVLMFELRYGKSNSRVILAGDAERKTEKNIIATYKREKAPADFLRCTAVKMGHHGGNEASSPEWAVATQPDAIFASGDFVWRHPYCEAIGRFKPYIKPSWILRNSAYYTCGKGETYWDNPTNQAVCVNLFYTVLSLADEKLCETDDLNNLGGKARIGKPRVTYGVQWEFTLTSGEEPGFGVTTFVRPAPGQKIPPPFPPARAVPDVE